MNLISIQFTIIIQLFILALCNYASVKRAKRKSAQLIKFQVEILIVIIYKIFLHEKRA